MQCVRSCVAQQPDELSLEKADIILVHQQSSDRKTNLFPSVISSQEMLSASELKVDEAKQTLLIFLCIYFDFLTDWVEGTRLSDRHRGWVPESHLEIISNSKVRNRNLSDAQKLTTATAAV